jgi:hypothetical protein
VSLGRRLKEVLVVTVLLIWSWPGLEQYPLFAGNRVFLFGLIVGLVSLRDFISYILATIWRSLIKLFIKLIKRVRILLDPNQIYLTSGTQIFLIPLEITDFQSLKQWIPQTFSLQEFDSVRFLVRPQHLEGVPDLNEYWRFGIHFSSDNNISASPELNKPLLHLTRGNIGEGGNVEENQQVRLAKYEGGYSILPKDEPIINGVTDLMMEIHVKYSYDGTILQIKNKDKIIYEELLDRKYRYFRFSLWSDINTLRSHYDDDNKRMIFVPMSPAYFEVSYTAKG